MAFRRTRRSPAESRFLIWSHAVLPHRARHDAGGIRRKPDPLVGDPRAVHVVTARRRTACRPDRDSCSPCTCGAARSARMPVVTFHSGSVCTATVAANVERLSLGIEKEIRPVEQQEFGTRPGHRVVERVRAIAERDAHRLRAGRPDPPRVVVELVPGQRLAVAGRLERRRPIARSC